MSDSVTITVPLENKSYPIHMGQDLTPEIKKTLQDLQYHNRHAAIVTDEAVANAKSDFLASTCAGLPKFIMPAGESSKSLDTLQKLYHFMVENNLDRSSVLFALGGGVVGDVTGFAAATYMRGIEFYQIPTTLLAMVDSSIGGKTSVNLDAGKSLVGAFHQPQGVFVDFSNLQTLPAGLFNAGMAEVIKYGLIQDLAFFERLESATPPLPPQTLADIIKTSCQIKSNIVSKDEKEQSGLRALLNYGHTFAHAIETVSKYKQYNHGEAVALGILLAARLSVILGYLQDADVDRIRAVIKKFSLPTELKEPLPFDALYEAMLHDKKVVSGQLKFVILESLGKASVTSKIDKKWLHLVLREVGATD